MFKFNQHNLSEINLDSYIELSQNLSKIDKNNIDVELQEITTYYSYYHGLLIRSKRQYDKSVSLLERARSCLWLDVKKDTSTKATAKDLEAKVMCDKHIEELNEEMINSEEIYGYYKSICSTLSMKKDMLVQINADRRSEIKMHS